MPSIHSEITNLITTEVEEIKESLTMGIAENHEQYQHFIGQINGLRRAAEIIKSITKLRLEEDED